MTAAARWRLALVLLALAAVGVRLLPWRQVFTDRGVRLLVDGDPQYHVLRAERILRGRTSEVWFDPNLDWPHGARVIWPPLFDAVLAGAARVLAGPDATRDEIARVAALVPPVLGAAGVVLGALLVAAAAGRGVALIAGTLLCVLPLVSHASVVGRPDQHALEVPLACAAWLGFAHAWRSAATATRGAASAAGGAAVALAFWNWMGSAIVLVPPALAVAALHFAGERSARSAARALAAIAAVALALLVPSVALLGPPGALARGDVSGIGLLHVAIVAGCGVYAGLLAAAPSPRGGEAGTLRRAGEIAAAVAVPAAALGGVPALRAGALQGLRALWAGDAWYATILEFRPVLGSGEGLVRDAATALGFLGLVPALAALAVPSVRRRIAEHPDERAPLGVLCLWAAILFALALARRRFGPYAAVPLAGVAAVAVAGWSARAAGRLGTRARGWATAGMAAVALAPTLAYHAGAGPPRSDPLAEALRWLGAQPPRPDGRNGVAAPWDSGHAVQFYARRPVLVSPFGTEAGPRSMEDWGALLYSTDEGRAREILDARRIGWVLLRLDLGLWRSMRRFAPPGAPDVATATRSFWRGGELAPTPEIGRLVTAQLVASDGAATLDGGPALTGFRLVYEAGSDEDGDRVALFEVVPGARLEVGGVEPGARVVAAVEVLAPTGRRFDIRFEAVADREGRVAFRIPYATGPNGASSASPAAVTDGRSERPVNVPAEAVIGGGVIAVSM